jgi:glycerol-3-phosphate acyltransferase PlsY
MHPITWIELVLISFLCGSLPFSVWLGKLFLRLDVRQFGDGNPGATNVFRAGNRLLGLLALILDVSKAAAPVGVAYYNLGFRGLPMFLVAIAPILGHVFSPFLGFKGGKALSVALGVWIGLTIWKISLAAVVGVVFGLALFTSPAWAVMMAMGVILLVLVLWIPNPLLVWVWAGEMIILVWTHRAGLRLRPRLRGWLSKRLFKSGG